MLKPLRNQLIIKPEEVVQETKSGIVLGYQLGQSELLRQIYPDKAEIVEVGDGVKSFTIGDRVVFSRYNAKELGDGWCVVYDTDVLAKIEEVG